jgi:hypothetical protein
MPYFARLNSENVVIFVERVVGVADGDAEGEAFLQNLYGTTDRFRFCKYDGTQRKQYPGIGYTFDEINDVFLSRRPYPSWALDQNHDWQPPTPRPEGEGWQWDEESQEWKS